jgi:flavin reductase ActVB
MRRFASGVTVVTTRDPAGRPHGLTGTSFCSVSLEPPLVLVCLSTEANSYAAFSRCAHFAISILRHDQQHVAERFSAKGTDKFAGDGFVETRRRLPVVDDAVSVLECVTFARHQAGDHVIMVGEVEAVTLSGGDPLVHFDRRFGSITDLMR